MKNLHQYIVESEQTYDFKIKIAGIEIDNDALDRIEHALSAYDVASVSKPKRLPIKDKNLDFPSMKACEVTLIIASMKYPCTDDQVRQAIGSQGRFPLSSIVVIPKDSPEELLRDQSEEDETTDKNKAPILTKELEQISGGQLQVGTKRIESMLKELETRKTDFASNKTTPAPKTSNCSPQNNVSPVARKGK